MKIILMVDDVSTNIKCATEVLKDKYQVITAKNGATALLILEETKPDLIILDINMPDMDGYELLKIIKSIKECAEVPVIFLTAENDEESKEKGLRMGAVDYLIKPFGPQILLKRVDEIICDPSC